MRPLIPLALFLAAFIYLLFGLNPSFYADDSPETITAAATLGVPHPPGYPLLTLMGRLASLLPLGGIPLRVNLLSAFLAALICALLYLFLERSLKVSPGRQVLDLAKPLSYIYRSTPAKPLPPGQAHFWRVFYFQGRL